MPLREHIARAMVPAGQDPDGVTWFLTGRMAWWEAWLPEADRVIAELKTLPGAIVLHGLGYGVMGEPAHA